MDKLDAAIASLPQGDPPDMRSNVTVPIQIATTNRGVILSIPVDITDSELLELAAYLILPAGGLRARLAAEAPPSRIVIARGTIS